MDSLVFPVPSIFLRFVCSPARTFKYSNSSLPVFTLPGLSSPDSLVHFVITMSPLLLLLSLLFPASGVIADCVNPIYKRFAANHTACREDNPSCDKTRVRILFLYPRSLTQTLQIGVTDKEIQEILKIHNDYRQKVASGEEEDQFKFPSASNMMKLVWDAELADIAQSHANQCDFNHDCNACREVDDFQVGQNLYQRKTSWLNPQANWTKAIQSFYDEISFTPLKVLSRFKGGAYGHFTQLVWADTWKIGCGYAAYHINESIFRIEELYVCNYGPSGNLRGQRMYRKGKPASKCPVNTVPSDEHSALCDTIDTSGPKQFNASRVAASSKTLYFCDFSNDSVCGLKIQHQNNSFLVDGLLHHYLSFILNATEKVTIDLPRTFKSKTGFCVQSMQRKGANDASEASNNQLKVMLAIPDFDWFTELDFGKDSNEWITANINVNWEHSTTMQITFEVPAEAGEQFFEIRSLMIREGKCPK